jgi:hypothetical protein
MESLGLWFFDSSRRRMIQELRIIASGKYPAHPVQVSIDGRKSAKLVQDHGLSIVPAMLVSDKMWIKAPGVQDPGISYTSTRGLGILFLF